MARKCTKTSSPDSGLMKPKPLSALNHLTVPTAMKVGPLSAPLAVIDRSRRAWPMARDRLDRGRGRDVNPAAGSLACRPSAHAWSGEPSPIAGEQVASRPTRDELSLLGLARGAASRAGVVTPTCTLRL